MLLAAAVNERQFYIFILLIQANKPVFNAILPYLLECSKFSICVI